jgi:hypothetical protein
MTDEKVFKEKCRLLLVDIKSNKIREQENMGKRSTKN